MADPLQTSLKGWWECDEASGNLVDAHATAGDATAVNAPGATTGLVSGARSFVRTSSQYFSLASNSSIEVGAAGDFTIAIQLYTTESNTRYALGKFDGVGAGDFVIFQQFNGSDHQFVFRVYASGGFVSSICGVGRATSTWYSVICRHVASTKTIDTSIDGGAFASAQTYTGTLGSNTGTLEFGQLGNGNDSTFYWNGRLDNIVIAHRAWDTTDVAEYYQSGAGRGYVQASSGNRRRRAIICGAA